MTLQIAKGGGFNQMFLELCFSVMLMMRGGGFQSNAPGSFSVMTRHDEKRRRCDPMLWALYFRIL